MGPSGWCWRLIMEERERGKGCCEIRCIPILPFVDAPWRNPVETSEVHVRTHTRERNDVCRAWVVLFIGKQSEDPSCKHFSLIQPQWKSGKWVLYYNLPKCHCLHPILHLVVKWKDTLCLLFNYHRVVQDSESPMHTPICHCCGVSTPTPRVQLITEGGGCCSIFL